MAGYRQFQTEFWKDEYIIDLEPLEKLLYAYLFTNELSSISGLYKIPLRVIVNETGLDKEFVLTCLAKFENDSKILYRDGVMWVVNMQKHHKNASPMTMKKVQNDVDEIGDCIVKRAYLYRNQTGRYSIDTVSILISLIKREREREREREEEEQTPPPASPPPPQPRPLPQPVPQPLPEPSPELPISSDWYIRVFCAVTGMMAFPGTETEKVIPALDGLYAQHNRNEDALVEYLKPYYAAWLATKSKYGQTYRRTNCGWLYDWAVAGEIPKPAGEEPVPDKGKKPVLTPEQQAEWDRAMAARRAAQGEGK